MTKEDVEDVWRAPHLYTELERKLAEFALELYDLAKEYENRLDNYEKTHEYF